MKRADESIPWKVTDISLRPYSDMWSMNPSIHFDGARWRCVLRCTDYAMPAGVTIRSRKAKPGETRTKNVMVIFDPVSWKPAEIYKMRERDDLPRTPCLSVGYEDVRIFGTDAGGLQGIAASLHLRRSERDTRGGFVKQPAEQVLLSFDAEYNIAEARPIRGSWSGSPQKNWVPFDDCAAPRFLYAIDQGKMFDDRGEMRTGEALVRPSKRGRSRSHAPDDHAVRRAQKRAAESEVEREQEQLRQTKRDRGERERGRRPLSPGQEPQQTYEGLRGGSQLVRIDDGSWLGIGHSMKFVDGLKYYWHAWYLVDSRGKMVCASAPMKLATNGIEFAAGLAVDGERVVVSFGVDDMLCRIGETKLAAVIETLRPIKPPIE